MQFELEECEQLAQEQVAAQKQLDREVAERQRILERHHSATFKTFDAPLSSYKRKDDLKDIATALALDNIGTIPTLIAHIRTHLEENWQLAEQPRFTSLYHASRRPQKHTTEEPTTASVPMGSSFSSNNVIDPSLFSL